MSTFAQPATVHVNGVDLYYVEQGMGPVVVFVHGGGATDFRTWAPQIDSFAQHYRVVAYSLRYHYPNAWAGDGSDYTATTHAEDLAALIETLRLAPAHVVGSSYGGEIALLLARQRPQVVRTLVLAEPALTAWQPKVLPEMVRSADAHALLWEASARAVHSGDFEKGVKLFASRVLGEGAYERLPDSVRQRMLDNARVLGLPEDAVLSDFSCADAGRIEAATLLLTGDASPRQFLAVADELARCMPHAERATIPHASHLLHGMNPIGFNQTVLAFLAKC